MALSQTSKWWSALPQLVMDVTLCNIELEEKINKKILVIRTSNKTLVEKMVNNIV